MKNFLTEKATGFVQKAMSGEIKSVKSSIVNVDKTAKLGAVVAIMGMAYAAGANKNAKASINDTNAGLKNVEKQVSHLDDGIEEIREILASNNIVQRYPAHDTQEEK